MKAILTCLLILSLACASSAGPQSKKVACEKCPVGWTFWRNSCYRFFNDRDSTWDVAEAFCNEYSLSRTEQSHLVTIDSQEENYFILGWWRTMRTTANGVNVWIGYNDKKTENVFVGSDGSCPKFTNWDTDEPNNAKGREDCVTMRKTIENGDNGSWNDIPCSLPRPFICKIAKSVSKVSGGCYPSWHLP